MSHAMPPVFIFITSVCAFLHAQVNALETTRCTHGAAGDMVGSQVYQHPRELVPPGRREYLYKVPTYMGCSLNGVDAKVCDLYSPDVEVDASLSEVRVRRLGPRLRPLHIQITFYCDPDTSHHGKHIK